MEIYRNSTAYTSIQVPASIVSSGPTVDVTAWAGSTLVHTFDAVEVTTDPSGFRALIPWSLNNEDRTFTVDWRVTYTENGQSKAYRTSQEVEVVTPILPRADLAEMAGWTDEKELNDLERRVRHVIQSYTGQQFSKYFQTFEVRANARGSVQLPAPLLMLADGRRPNTTSNGWALSVGTHVGHHHDILYPFRKAYGNQGVHRISGWWGYESVPADVEQAARLLAVDYSHDESLWRDRYMDSVRAGNWRFEMNARSFDGTGNVVADQILSKYRRLSLALV